ncbi:LLM class flavin-dependent oxidoreductase, partial [Cronobacter sakazakii]
MIDIGCAIYARPENGINMKKIGFLSFGHWTPSPQSATR